MDRAESTGLGVSVGAHLALLAALTLGFASVRTPPIASDPIEVSFVEDVALRSASPSIEPPAQSLAPEIGAPDEAAPVPEPVPAPPEPVPPPPRPQPAPPEPKPVPKPAEKPAPSKPAPKAAAKPEPKAAQPKTPPAKTKTETPRSGSGERTRGSRLGSDFLKGIGSDASKSKAQAPRGAVMSSQAMASIGQAILRQVQPCADRQRTPGPGAERIRVAINLKLNRDGSLASRPRITGRDGVDDENRRYADRVDDLAIATFTGCSPLRGLPDELYDVPNGWSDFTLRYKLPG
ncbi:hypothetical protein [Allosphingosinicella indica]|uniref:Cell division and transport-associated protein TolA n=1 Tax=Allosphingosinicella indica TaxID=941907 RepID=A0A1X7GAA0_9SPHN|nr:hypothetical protein [Allosphingosinicella indica]SMF66677.1 Cell division and transport-associated protein TolA [Allosphingosinicella indica]